MSLLGPNRYHLFDHPRKYQKVNVTHKIPIKQGVDVKMAYRGKYRKKNNRKRRRRGMKRNYIPRAIQPKTKLVRLKATKYFQMNSTTVVDKLTIQGNAFDDIFGVDHTLQPLGYDQWKALYKKAIVVGTKVRITAHNEAANSVFFGISAMSPNQGTTSLDNYEHYKEMPGTVSRILSPDMDHGVLTLKRSTKRHLSYRNIRDEDDLEIDLVNETPPSKLYWIHAWCQATDVTTASAVEFVADVEYIILLKDPIVPARSVET